MIKVTLIDTLGTDLSVVNAARVSFGKKSDWDYGPRLECSLKEKDASLIKYLASGMSSGDLEKWKQQMITANDPDTVMEAYNALSEAEPHKSPFGHAFASFHVKAPIFVARQLVKHKFLRWNEISRRYVDDEPEFYMPEVWRGRSEDKKQGSYTPEEQPIEWLGVNVGTYEFYREAYDRYKWMLDIGIAPEQARMVLPLSTMTEFYWSGSLDAFADMAKLRLKEDTQYETRLVADQISKEMKQLFPVSWEALVGEQT